MFNPDRYDPAAASKVLLLGALNLLPVIRACEVAQAELNIAGKLDFLFNRGVNQSAANAENAARSAAMARRIGVADTQANRAEVTRLMNEAYRNSSSIVEGGSNVAGRNLREFFLPGVTATGSKIQFVEEAGNVITIFAK